LLGEQKNKLFKSSKSKIGFDMLERKCKKLDIKIIIIIIIIIKWERRKAARSRFPLSSTQMFARLIKKKEKKKKTKNFNPTRWKQISCVDFPFSTWMG
jgi:uncharacterized membrane protein